MVPDVAMSRYEFTGTLAVKGSSVAAPSNGDAPPGMNPIVMPTSPNSFGSP